MKLRLINYLWLSDTHLDEPTYCAYYNEPSKEYYILD